MPKREVRRIPNSKRIETLDVFNPCVAACMVVLLAVTLVVLAFTPGWYYVHYKDNAEGPMYCDLRLLECTLADCKVDIGYTGNNNFEGEGDCSSWHAAQFFFILAAIYSGSYALYMAGILHGQAKNWAGYAAEGSYSKCCVDTSCDLGEVCPGEVCVDKGPCRGKLPHGSLGLGAPILMLLGLMNFLNQDLSHIEGVDAGLGFNFWFCVSTMVICSCCIGAVAFDAANDEEAVRRKLGKRVATRALPNRPPMDAGAAAGANAQGNDEDDDGPTEGERALKYGKEKFNAIANKAKGAVAQARSSTPERGGQAGADARRKAAPPALPLAQSGTPPRTFERP